MTVSPSPYDPEHAGRAPHRALRPFAAATALRDAVAAGKHGDPLAPVSVVVPTNYVGVAARRMLGSGALGPVTDRGVGVAGVTFLTVYRVAELLGAPRLAAAGRRPVSTPVLGAAVRGRPRARARACSRRSRNTRQPNRRSSTRTASSRSATTTRSTGSRARAGARPTSCASTAPRARTLAGEWYDERDLMDAAVAAVGDGSPVLADLGAIVLYLPQDCRCRARALLRARRRPRAAHGRRGRHRRRARRCRRRRRARAARPRRSTPSARVRCEPPHGTEVVSASDPDDEVRAAVRLVMAALVDGVPLERMAILYGATEPYARLVHEQLDAAGIPHNGAAVRTLAESVLGRSLLGLLALPDRDFHRHDVMALLAAAPVWFRRAPGAVGTLGAHQPARGRRPRRDAVARAARPPRRDAGSAAGRGARGARPRAAPDWYEHELRRGARARRVRRRAPRRARRRGATPGAELARARRLGAAARARLPRPRHAPRARGPRPSSRRPTRSRPRSSGSPASTRSSPRPASTCSAARSSSSSTPTSAASAGSATASSWATSRSASGSTSTACSCAASPRARSPRGSATTRCSPTPTARATDGVLPLRASARRRRPPPLARRARGARARRARAALPARRPPPHHRAHAVAVPARHRGGARRHPSLRRRPAPARRRLVPPGPVVRRRHRTRRRSRRPSRSTGCARCSTTPGNGGDIATSALRDADAALARGLDCALARASTAFTRFDGNLGGLAGAEPRRCRRGRVADAARALGHLARSTTSWSTSCGSRSPSCPRRSTSSRRSTAARSCTRRSTSSSARCSPAPAAPPRPARPGPTADRARLHEIADAQCDRVRGARAHRAPRVLGPRPAPDPRRPRPLPRRRRRSCAPSTGSPRSPPSSRFGLPEAEWPAIELACPTAAGCGSAARPTASTARADGALLVIDYKTGHPFAVGDEGDPTSAGTSSSSRCTRSRPRSAFGNDAHAAWSRRTGSSSTRGDFRWAEVALDEPPQTRFDEVLRAIVDGIERGVFPCSLDPPDSWHAPWRTYADPDGRGTRDRYRDWVRKRGRARARRVRRAARSPTTSTTSSECERRTARMTVVQPELELVVDEDAATRAAIVDDLGDTLFVEAGAGSGKTKSLVDRVVALVTRAGVPMREIAAVTFTEKAAAELRDRIRRELEQVASASPGDRRSRRRRARRARRRRGLHAARVRAAAAHRAPDRGRAAAPHRGARRDRVAGRVRGALDALRRPPARRPGARAHAAARAERRHRPRHAPHDRARVQRQLGPRRGAHGSPSPTRRRSTLDRAARRAPRRRARSRARAPTPTTSSPSGSVELDGWRDRLRARARRVRAAPAAHRGPRRSSARSAGRQGQLAVDVRRATPSERAVAAVREQAAAITARGHRGHGPAPGVGDRAVHARARPTSAAGAASSSSTTCSCSPARCCATREHGWDVRRRLRERYTHLLLDEFQDTDPIQFELAALLASGDPDARDRRVERDRRSTPGACSSSATQAVDLPVPPRRHRHVPARAFGVRRRAASPHLQLPHRRGR